jgi:hypothetical protein
MKTVHRAYSIYLAITLLLIHDGTTCRLNSIDGVEVLSCYYCDHAEVQWLLCQSIKTRPFIRFGKKDVQSDNDRKVRVSAEWDEEGLYFFFAVTDVSLSSVQTIRDHRLLSRDDVVEVLIDPLRQAKPCWSTNDRIYHFNLLGQVKDDQGSDSCKSLPAWNGSAQVNMTLYGTLNDQTDIDNGYEALVWVPWQDIGGRPSYSDLRINLAVGDNGHFEDWCETTRFRSPDKFKWLRLIK